MNIDELLSKPELTVEIAGIEYRFSALPLDYKAELQSWIRQAIPNPLQAIKPFLADCSTEERIELLDRARKELQSWPPDISEPAGRTVLLRTHEGQVETFFWGLKVHQPEMTKAQADKIFRVLKFRTKQEGEAAARAKRRYMGGDLRRIYAVIFENILPEDEEGLPDLKSSAPVNGLIGAYSSAEQSKN